MLKDLSNDAMSLDQMQKSTTIEISGALTPWSTLPISQHPS